MRWIARLIALLAYFAASVRLTEGGIVEDGLFVWGLCAILLFVVVLVHEAGHAVVASKVGAEVRSIMVFPFQLDLKPHKFGMAHTRRRGDVGGHVAFKLDRLGAGRKHALIALAGPAANILSTSLLILLGSIAWHSGGTDAGLQSAWAIAEAFAVLSFGVGLANLLPFEGSDGMVLLRGMRGRIGTAPR